MIDIAKFVAELRKREMDEKGSISALYSDNEKTTILYYAGPNAGLAALAISRAEWQNISTAACNMQLVDHSETYPDDPSAQITYLHPNDLVRLLTRENQRHIVSIQEKHMYEAQQARFSKYRRNPITGHFLGGSRQER